MSGDRHWFIVGCYLASDNALTIEDVIAAISQRPLGAALLVVGDFSTNLVVLEVRDQDKGIAEAVAEDGMEDIRFHFLPRHKPWLKDSRTWGMHRCGR